MARSFLLLSLLVEAENLDAIASQKIRNRGTRRPGLIYVHNYRLTPELVRNLEKELKPLLPVAKRRRGLTYRIKLLCTLSFLANGSYQKFLAKNVNTILSQPSTSRSLHQIIDALNHPTIVSKYIRFPRDAAERQALKDRFYEKFNIPGVLGCIDSTLVAMVKPKENEKMYFCDRGYHAMNVQLITDADLNILHVDPSRGGACHASVVFDHSQIKNHLEEVRNSGEVVYILGDSGYAPRPYLMTPIENAEEHSPAAHYTQLHAAALRSAARAVGVLKGRFRCLAARRALHYRPDMVAKIVVACCVLHNVCNRAGVPGRVAREETLPPEARGGHRGADRLESDSGRTARSQLVHRLWQSRDVQ